MNKSGKDNLREFEAQLAQKQQELTEQQNLLSASEQSNTDRKETAWQVFLLDNPGWNQSPDVPPFSRFIRVIRDLTVVNTYFRC